MIKNLLLRRSILHLFAFTLFLFSPNVRAQNIPANTRMLQVNTTKGSVLSLVEFSESFVYHLGTSNSGEIGIDGLSATSLGNDDLFILKSNASTGSNVWLKTFDAGTGGTITPRYISIDASENLYVYGQFNGTVTAGGKSITATPTASSFLMKINSNGSAAWVTQLAGANNTTYPKIKCVTDGTDTFIIYNQNHLARINDTDGSVVYDNIYSDAELKSVALNGSSLYVAGSALSTSVVFNSELIPAGNGFMVKGDKNATFSASAVAALISEPGFYGPWTDVSDIAVAADGSLLITGFSKGAMKIRLQNYSHNYSINPNGSFSNDRIYHYFAKITPNFGDVAPFTVSSPVSSDATYGIQSRIMHSKIKLYGSEGKFRITYTNNHFDNRNTINSFTNINGTNTSLISSGGGTVYKVLLACNSYGGFSGELQPQTNGILSNGGNHFSVSSQSNRLFKTVAYFALSDASAWTKEKTSSSGGSLSNAFQQHLNSAKNDLFVTSIVEGQANFFGKKVYNASGVSSRYVTRLGIDGLPKWYGRFHPDSGTRELNAANDFSCVDKDDNFIFLANTSGASSTFIDATGNFVDFSQNAGKSSKAIIKLNKDGGLVWSKQIIPSQAANITASVTTDNVGNVYVLGVTNQNLSVDGANMAASGPYSIFMIKFSPAGSLIYSKSYQNVGAFSLLPVFDAENNLYVFAEPMNNQSTDFVFDGVTIPASAEGVDHLMLKFNQSGNVVSGKNFYADLPAGSSGYSWPNDVLFDGEDFMMMGNYYNWGSNASFYGLDLQPIPKVYSPASWIPFFAKIKTDGTVVWQKPLHVNNANSGSYTNIGLDENKNLYMFWYLKDKMSVDGTEYTFDATNGNKILTKLDANGMLKYNKVVDSNLNVFPMIDVFGEDKLNLSSFTSSDNILNYPVNNNRAANFYIATFGDLDDKYLTATKEYLELNNIVMTNNPGNDNIFTFDLINNVNWSANSDNSWLNLSYQSLTGKYNFRNLISGSGDAKLIMSAQTNTTGANRTANVLISGDSGVSPKTIAITQSAVLASGETRTFVTTLYPNPTSDILNIETKQKISKIEIFDMNGRLLKTADGKDKKVWVSEFGTGIYIIILHTENGVVNSKFIKK